MWFLVRAPYLACCWLSFCCILTFLFLDVIHAPREKERSLSLYLLIRTLILLKAPASWPNLCLITSPKFSPPNSITLGKRVSGYEIRVDINIQYITIHLTTCRSKTLVWKKIYIYIYIIKICYRFGKNTFNMCWMIQSPNPSPFSLVSEEIIKSPKFSVLSSPTAKGSHVSLFWFMYVVNIAW